MPGNGILCDHVCGVVQKGYGIIQKEPEENEIFRNRLEHSTTQTTAQHSTVQAHTHNAAPVATTRA